METTNVKDALAFIREIKRICAKMIEVKRGNPSVCYVYSEVTTRLAQLEMAIATLAEEVRR